MKDNKEIIEQEEKKSDSSGIQLNKKTLFGITALLLAIMIFAGIIIN